MKTIGEMSSSIEETNRKKRQLEIIDQARARISMEIINKSDVCNHNDVLVFLGEDRFDRPTGPNQVYVCLECSKVLRVPHGNTNSYYDEKIKNAKVLDFSKNPSSLLLRGNSVTIEYIAVTALKNALVEAANNNPNMTMEEFISSIPEDWYTNPKAFDDESRVK